MAGAAARQTRITPFRSTSCVVPLLVRQLGEGYPVGDPGVGHDRVQRPVPILNGRYHGVNLVSVRDVQVTVLGLTAARLDVDGD